MKKIYFFNGWGMEETILKNISNSTDYKIEVINYPYNLNLENLKKENIIFIAWSFGVYYLNKFLNENKDVTYTKAIALNGTTETIGEYGINHKMFNLTLATLNPENLKKFYENMNVDENFSESNKNFEIIKQELQFFKDNYKVFNEIKIDYFFIGIYDRIIPRQKQEKFCIEKGKDYKLIDCGHYPFTYFKDFKDIIFSKNKENE